MQQPEADRPPVSLEVVRATVRVALDDRFIDREVVTVQAADRDHLRMLQVGEELAVEDADRGLARDRVRLAANGVVLDVLGVRGEDCVDIALLLRREVALEDPIDLVARPSARYGSGATGREGARSGAGAKMKRYDSAAMAAPMSGPTKCTYQLS